MTASRPTGEGQTGVEGMRKHLSISRKFFLHMLEKNESCIEGAGGGPKVGELRYGAMQEGGPRTSSGLGNGERLFDVAG